MDKKLRYLSTRRELLQSPTYQQAGWPIGSGMVESANKLVMQTRRVWPRDALGAYLRQPDAGSAVSGL